MELKFFFELLFSFCAIIGYFKFFYYLFYKRIFTEERFVKFNGDKLFWLVYLFVWHCAFVIFLLQWTKHNILLGIGNTLFIYNFHMKEMYDMLK